MRLKSRWFSADGTPAAKGAEEQGGAMAFITFRVALQMLKRMRAAGFDIDAGTPYFRFVAEVLVFLVAVADRIAYARLEAEARQDFVVALVRHVARHLAGNVDDLLGPAPAGEPGCDERFIDLYNEVAGHYAEFGADPRPGQAQAQAQPSAFTPDFAFMRYLGARLEPVLPERDRRWVLDQVMAIEAPEAVALVQRTMGELFDPQPRRPRRQALSGE